MERSQTRATPNLDFSIGCIGRSIPKRRFQSFLAISDTRLKYQRMLQPLGSRWPPWRTFPRDSFKGIRPYPEMILEIQQNWKTKTYLPKPSRPRPSTPEAVNALRLLFPLTRRRRTIIETVTALVRTLLETATASEPSLLERRGSAPLVQAAAAIRHDRATPERSRVPSRPKRP